MDALKFGPERYIVDGEYIGLGTQGEMEIINDVRDDDHSRYTWASERMYRRLLPVAGHKVARKIAHARYSKDDIMMAMGSRLLMWEMWVHRDDRPQYDAEVVNLDDYRSKKRKRVA